MPQAFEEVKSLYEHDKFDAYNPNKVYALLNTFGVQNPVNFHRKDGLAYTFYADKVIEIMQFNPQVAGRIAKAFSVWTRHDAQRQALMEKELQRILNAAGNVKDIYEIASKLLEAKPEKFS